MSVQDNLGQEQNHGDTMDATDPNSSMYDPMTDPMNGDTMDPTDPNSSM